MLIFFVTGRCNASCLHCFYWQNLGADHWGHSLEDVKKLTDSAPQIKTLLISGGEPTLRKDLPGIIELFVANNHVKQVAVPTNGLLPDRITELAREILTRSPGIRLSFNLSIDGFAVTHDVIRNQAGSFDKALITLKKLSDLSKEYKNFSVLVNTVIYDGNVDQVVPFARYMESTGLVNGHFFEIIRGNPRDPNFKKIPAEMLKRIYSQLIPIQARYLVIERQRHTQGLRRIAHEILDVGNLIVKYRHQWKNYTENGKWNFPCLAGERIGTIDYDGKMRICELRSESVQLNEHDYNFERAWQSRIIRDVSGEAKTHNCDCTHTCFLDVSMHRDLKTEMLTAPWYYLLFKLGRGL